MRRHDLIREEAPASRLAPTVSGDLPGGGADELSLPPAGEVTASNAVFLRLLEVTDDPDVRSFLRRIVAVPD